MLFHLSLEQHIAMPLTRLPWNLMTLQNVFIYNNYYLVRKLIS